MDRETARHLAGLESAINGLRLALEADDVSEAQFLAGEANEYAQLLRSDLTPKLDMVELAESVCGMGPRAAT